MRRMQINVNKFFVAQVVPEKNTIFKNSYMFFFVTFCISLKKVPNEAILVNNLLWKIQASQNMNLPESMHMYWTDFRQPTVHFQQIIFEITFIEVGSSHLYASFGTFWVQIGQLVEAQWDFKLSEEFEIDVIFLRKQRFYRFHTFFKDSLCLE